MCVYDFDFCVCNNSITLRDDMITYDLEGMKLNVHNKIYYYSIYQHSQQLLQSICEQKNHHFDVS